MSSQDKNNSKQNNNVSESEALTNCLLSQWKFCAGGVGLGAAYAIKKSKGPIPMVAAGVAGTLGDLMYGYFVACSEEGKLYESSLQQNKK
jgi:hypothetical protein